MKKRKETEKIFSRKKSIYNLFSRNKKKFIELRYLYNQNTFDLYNHKIDSIQKNIDSVILVNKQLDTQIEQIHGEVGVLDNNIDNVQTNIKTIKGKTNEKVISVNEFTFSDLNKFFTDRYQSNNKGSN